jgi:hypothetical protein
MARVRGFFRRWVWDLQRPGDLERRVLAGVAAAGALLGAAYGLLTFDPEA